MYPRPFTIRLDLHPNGAEFLYWELMAIRAHYNDMGQQNPLTHDEALVLGNTIRRLESELQKAQALAEVRLQQLRPWTTASSAEEI